MTHFTVLSVVHKWKEISVMSTLARFGRSRKFSIWENGQWLINERWLKSTLKGVQTHLILNAKCRMRMVLDSLNSHPHFIKYNIDSLFGAMTLTNVRRLNSTLKEIQTNLKNTGTDKKKLLSLNVEIFHWRFPQTRL